MIKITNTNNYLRLQIGSQKVEYLPKGQIRFALNGDEIILSLVTGFGRENVSNEYRFKYQQVLVPTSSSPENLMIILSGYQDLGQLYKIEQEINDIKNDLSTLLDNDTVGNTGNLSIRTANNYLSNARIVSSDDIVCYYMSALIDNGAIAPSDYVQVHECNPVLNITAIADDGGGDCRLTVPGHTFVGAENVFLQDVTGTPLLNGVQVVAGVGVDTIDIAVAFVADGTGILSEDIADGTAPILVFPIVDHLVHSFGDGERFANGMYVCNSSTIATKTVGNADTIFYCKYHSSVT